MAAESGRTTKPESNPAAELRFWRWWFALGIAMILLVAYLSLANIYLPQLPSTIGDKINHLLAYGVLTGWFGQLFIAQKTRLLIAVSFVVLGVLMEYLQSRTGYRHLDQLDALANTLGVLLGVLALHFGADKILLWFESRYLKTS